VTDLDKRFLTNTDETGRFIVKSLTTGKKYYIEPIGNGRPADWGDIIITDPCYIIKKDSEDWRKCDYGDWSCSTWSTPRKDVETQLEELNALGRARWELMKQYGEDSVQAKIYDDKIADASLNIKEIGHFCADAGMVAVFLLDEVLKYNPDFDYHINREWTTTLIKDFDGEVNYYVDSEDDARIIGVGNINFFTSQVGI
jgi:hypothetical protein